MAPGESRIAKSTRIGKYEIEAENEADRRAQIRIYRAFDRDTGRPVTLKMLADGSDSRLADRFRREVSCVAKLCNANIVAIYELGEQLGLPFAAMQHLGDDHLGRAIERRASLTLIQKMSILEQVASGAEAAHRGGLAYIGIRPAGIAIGTDGEATIHDFGIVRPGGAEPDESGFYTAPEESAADFSPDPLCDIFVFGVVCYQFLTGSHPFAAASSSEPVPLRELVPEYPEALERFVGRSLNKRRELRYQSLGELRNDLQAMVHELKRTPPAVRPEPVAPPPQKQIVPSRVEDLWRQADEEAVSRRFFSAVETLTSALSLDENNPETKRRLDKMHLRLDNSLKAFDFAVEARRLLDQGGLKEARGAVLKALVRDPGHPDANQLLAMITRAIERADKEARVQEGLEKANALLLQRSFDDALSILTGLRAENPDSAVIEQWIARAETRRTAALRQERLQALASQARSHLEQQQFVEAVALLDGAVVEFSDDAGLADLLVRAREALERNRVVEQAAERCDRLCGEERFDQALDTLDAALASYPAEPALLALRREVEEQWQSHQLASAVRHARDEVEWLLEQDRPDLAVRFLKQESAVLAAEPGLVSRLAEMEQMLPDWEQRRFLGFLQDYSMDRVGVPEQPEQLPVLMTVLEEVVRAGLPAGDLAETAERLRRRLQEQERRKKLEQHVEAIGQKVAAQDWPQAHSLVQLAQAEFPGEPRLQSLRKKVDEEKRRAERESIIAEVRRCLAGGDREQAEQVLRKGLESLGEDPALRALQQEVETYQNYSKEWKTAQALAGQRRFVEAEQILLRLTTSQRAEVRILLDLVREARAASDEKQFYRKGREKALLLVHQQNFEEAVDLFRKLLAVFPGDGTLVKDLEAAHAGLGGDGHPPQQRESEVSLAAPPVNREAGGSAPLVLRVSLLPAALKAVLMMGLLLLAAAGSAVWTFSRSRVTVPAADNPVTPAAPRRAEPAPLASPVAVLSRQPIPVPESRALNASRPKRVPEIAQTPHRAFTLTTRPSAATDRTQAEVLPSPPSTGPIDAAREASGVLPIDPTPLKVPAPPPPKPVANPAPPPSAPPAAVPRGEVQPPKLATGRSPRFPDLAKQRHIYGVVNLEATVDQAGKVVGVTVLSGPPPLIPAVKEAVLTWRYQPATIDGRPVQAKVAVTVRFHAEDGGQ